MSHTHISDTIINTQATATLYVIYKALPWAGVEIATVSATTIAVTAEPTRRQVKDAKKTLQKRTVFEAVCFQLDGKISLNVWEKQSNF